MSGQMPARMMNRQANRPMVGQELGQGINSSQPPRISIAGNRFTLIDSAGNTRPVTSQYIDQRTGQPVVVQATELDIIVVGTNPGISKVFFTGAFDPTGDANQPPTCFSDNGLAPSTQAATPQSPTCAACPNNAWGSRVNQQTGQQSKACNDKKKIAVMLAYDPSDMVYQLQIPPASLKAVKALTDWLAQQDFGGQKADVTDIITRVSFASQGVLKFEAAGFYDDATYAKVEHLLQTGQDKIDAMTGRNDVPRTAGAIAAPVQPQPQIAHQPTPQFAPPFVQPAAQYVAPNMPAPAAQVSPVHPSNIAPNNNPVQFQQPHPQQFAPQPSVGHMVNPAGMQQAPAANPQAPPQPRRRRGRPANGENAMPSQQAPQQPGTGYTPGPVQAQPFQQVAPTPLAQASPQQSVQSPPVAAPVATPAFLQPQPVQHVAVPVQPQQTFGLVQTPAAPDPGLSAQLAAAFNLPT